MFRTSSKSLPELKISFTKGSSSSTLPLTLTIVGCSAFSLLVGTVVDFVALRHEIGFSRSSSDFRVFRRAILVDAWLICDLKSLVLVGFSSPKLTSTFAISSNSRIKLSEDWRRWMAFGELIRQVCERTGSLRWWTLPGFGFSASSGLISAVGWNKFAARSRILVDCVRRIPTGFVRSVSVASVCSNSSWNQLVIFEYRFKKNLHAISKVAKISDTKISS